MARKVNRLTTLQVQKEKKPGMHPDGAGLYLRVAASGSKSWVLRYMLDGKAREMGLGGYPAISLSEARDKASGYRKLVADSIDPIDSRHEGKTRVRLEAAKSKTFKECAEAYIKAHEPAWSNEKHRWQWRNSLEKFVYPTIGDVSVQKIEVAQIVSILEPIWSTKTETATRVRGRIEAILDWAATREYRKGDNPARWKGHLQNLLPNPDKIQKVKHQESLPYSQLSAFMERLSLQSGTAVKALEFTILTASRTTEVLKMKWEEVDIQKRLWIVPAERIKTRKQHRVPLTERALEILAQIREENASQKRFCSYVFPSNRGDVPMSDMAMLMLLRRMKHKHITVHGFRTTFRTWAAEQTDYPFIVTFLSRG